jgi:hypothetical protein
MKLPEIRKLEGLLVASGIPYKAVDFREGYKIVHHSKKTRIVAAEYSDSHGLELLGDKRKYSILSAEDVFCMIKQQYERA